MQPDFTIISSGAISTQFVNRNIHTFNDAAQYVRRLRYGRNDNKNNLTTVFTDNCATCSTKHALLKQLAVENNFNDIRLVLGLFKMNRINTPAVARTLELHNLAYIPEAHCYLKRNNSAFEYTSANSSSDSFINDLIEEIEIQPYQITEFKLHIIKVCWGHG